MLNNRFTQLSPATLLLMERQERSRTKRAEGMAIAARLKALDLAIFDALEKSDRDKAFLAAQEMMILRYNLTLP